MISDQREAIILKDVQHLLEARCLKVESFPQRDLRTTTLMHGMQNGCQEYMPTTIHGHAMPVRHLRYDGVGRYQDPPPRQPVPPPDFGQMVVVVGGGRVTTKYPPPPGDDPLVLQQDRKKSFTPSPR